MKSTFAIAPFSLKGFEKRAKGSAPCKKHTNSYQPEGLAENGVGELIPDFSQPFRLDEVVRLFSRGAAPGCVLSGLQPEGSSFHWNEW